MLNCKEGDLAIIIAGKSAGKIVTCLKLIEDRNDLPISIRHTSAIKHGLWLIDEDISWECKIFHEFIGYFPYVSDFKLMPIRPEEIQEEEMKRIRYGVYS